MDETEEQRYERFVQQCRESGKIWGLKNADGWAICDSIEFEDTAVFPFWSTEEEARSHCSGDWKAYETEFIAMEDFLADWLPGMHEDHAMVGPNWNEDMEGLELEPADLAVLLEPED